MWKAAIILYLPVICFPFRYSSKVKVLSVSTLISPVSRDFLKPEVRLIDQEDEQVGIVPIQQALEMAEAAALDLVEISPNAEPPVCRIMNYGK